MKTNDASAPSLAEFQAHVRDAFAFTTGFRFSETPLPPGESVNQFQVRMSNGKVTVVVEGINWGAGTDVYLEDSAGVSVPLILFVSPRHRPPRYKGRGSKSDQLSQVRTAAQYLRDHCTDVLSGDMTRFEERASEWRRVSGSDRSYQKRELP
ncbi:MAG TPA: hypothetical protein VMF52_16285 [Steroidobacteraceae bacterium]|nr:hypothetical protein [Steroidobacteraceae bacterium]